MAPARLYAKYPQYAKEAALSPSDSHLVEVTPTHVFTMGSGLSPNPSAVSRQSHGEESMMTKRILVPLDGARPPRPSCRSWPR